VVYWGIILFGYDTCVSHSLLVFFRSLTWQGSGIAGGVVANSFFQSHFGLLTPDGKKDTNKVNNISANVVSVLMAGAFVGALSSAPISSQSIPRCIGSCWAPC
jgi:hypothetical protein